MDDANSSLFMWLGGLAVSALSGLFGFTHIRINQIQKDMKGDMTTMKLDIDERIAQQTGDHKQAQQQLWSELRLSENRATDHRQRIQDRLSELQVRIGQLPTREEMKDDLRTTGKQIETALNTTILMRTRGSHDGT